LIDGIVGNKEIAGDEGQLNWEMISSILLVKKSANS
jgi:hypothetical protein